MCLGIIQGFLCYSDSLRKLLPQMGKADGIPLRKMAILVKGIGVIYEIQIEEFASNLSSNFFLSI